MARVYVMLPYQLLSTRCLKRRLAPSTISINRLALKTRHETRAILKSFNCRLRNRILVSSYLSCGPQRSKNYIHNIPLEQDWYSDVTRPFLSVKGLAPQTSIHTTAPSPLKISLKCTCGQFQIPLAGKNADVRWSRQTWMFLAS